MPTTYAFATGWQLCNKPSWPWFQHRGAWHLWGWRFNWSPNIVMMMMMRSWSTYWSIVEDSHMDLNMAQLCFLLPGYLVPKLAFPAYLLIGDTYRFLLDDCWDCQYVFDLLATFSCFADRRSLNDKNTVHWLGSASRYCFKLFYWYRTWGISCLEVRAVRRPTASC